MTLSPIHIIPDTHIPFHDARAWRLNLKTIVERQPKSIIILGDLADLYSVSSHTKSPELRNYNLAVEAEAVNAEIDALQKAAGRATITYIMGNHEDRFDRYLADRAPELFGLTSVAQLFDLKKRKIKVVPYKEYHQEGAVYYTHDTGKAGVNAHRAAELAFRSNAVIGHTHRMGFDVVGNVKGSPHVSAMFGWLGDYTKAKYIPTINAKREWVLGFGTGWIKSDGTTFLNPNPIVNYEVCVDGQLIKG